MDLQSLSAIVNRNHDGYMRLNKSTNAIEIGGSHTFGKLIVWLRYKTSSSYRHSVRLAKLSLIDTMQLDGTYSKYFKARMLSSNVRFLNRNKPLSTREVRLFIQDVKREADIHIVEEAKVWISMYTAQGDYAYRSKQINDLDNKIDVMLAMKTKKAPGIEAEDIDRSNIGKILYRQAMADNEILAAVKPEKAEVLINRLLTTMLDGRIIKAQKQRRAMLKDQLSLSGLPSSTQQMIEEQINSSEIATAKVLDTLVNSLVIEQMENRFDSILEHTCKKYNLDKQFLELFNIKNSLRNYLPRVRGERLSIDSASRQIVAVLREQAYIKKAAANQLIDKLSGTDSNVDNVEQFNSRVDKMFKAKIADQPGLNRQNVPLQEIDKEIRETAQTVFNDFATMNDEQQASTLIDNFLSAALDKRIGRAREQLQARLKGELSEIDMPEQTRAEISAEIDSIKIADRDQLKGRIVGLVLGKIDSDFDALMAEATNKYRFNKAMLANPNTKKQLMQHLTASLTRCDKCKELYAMPIRSEAVQQLNQQRMDLVDGWVKQCTGLSGADSAAKFKDELSRAIAAEASATPDIKVDAISPEEIGHQIRTEMLNDRDDINAIENEDDARSIVLNKLSAMIKPRVDQMRYQSQQKLYKRLTSADLHPTTHQKLETAITEMQITTASQLNREINNSIVKNIDAEFYTMVEQVKKRAGFNEKVASLSTVRAQLRTKLAKRENLSLAGARKQAVKLLEQWVENKMDALKTIAPSRFAGSTALLKELVLQEPHITKYQVQELQQALKQTLEEVYRPHADTYDALGMEPRDLLSKLKQMESGDTLLGNLRTLVQQATKSISIFDNPTTWQVADVETAVQNYVANLTEPLVNTYGRVEQLKGQVPDSVYEGARKAVIEQGAVWGEDLIGNTNALYADTLKENTTAFYNLLEEPIVAQQNLGTRSNHTPFTFGDLIDDTIAKKKDIKKAEKRHQAVDQLLPTTQKNYLLETIRRDLSRERGKVMDSSIANDLCQQSALNVLRNANINFESKKIEFDQTTAPPTPAYETTV